MPSPIPAAVPTLTEDLLDDEVPEIEGATLVEHQFATYAALGAGYPGSDGTLAARLNRIEAQQMLAGTFGLQQLRIGNDATSPNNKITIAAAQLGIGGVVVSNLSVTADLTLNGANGFDNLTADPEDASTWYAAWVGRRPATGELCGLLSKSFTAPITTHASLNGLFTQWRLVSAIRNNASSNFKLFTQEDRWVTYEDGQDFGSLVNNSAANTSVANTPSTCRDVFPPICRRARLFYGIVAQSVGSYVLQTRRKGTTNFKPVAAIAQSPATTIYGYKEQMLDANQEFEWMAVVSPAANLSAGVNIAADAFYLPL